MYGVPDYKLQRTKATARACWRGGCACHNPRLRRGGGTGRRTGLKILGSVRSVRVRFPPPALLESLVTGIQRRLRLCSVSVPASFQPWTAGPQRWSEISTILPLGPYGLWAAASPGTGPARPRASWSAAVRASVETFGRVSAASRGIPGNDCRGVRPFRECQLMRLPLNQPLSTFLLVLSILAILLGIALFESGHAWLFHNSPSPSIGLWCARCRRRWVCRAEDDLEAPVVIAKGIDASKSDVGVVRRGPRRPLRPAR